VNDVPDTGHYDLDALAELDEGLAPDDADRRIRRHLDGCPDCADRLARVRTTRALLTTLPDDKIPDAVAARIHEAVEQSGEAGPALTGRTLVPAAAGRRWWRSPAFAGAAAAAVVALLVAGLVVGNIDSRHHATSNGTSAGSSNGSAAGGVDPDIIRSAAIKEWQTGTNYTPASIPRLVPHLVASNPSGSAALQPTPSPATAIASPTAPLGTVQFTFDTMRQSRVAVAKCGHILADDQTTVPLAVDFARFQGVEAVVVVLPSPGQPGFVDAFVLRTPCSAGALFQLYRVARGG